MMRSRPNAWHAAICTHLCAAGGPLRVNQIWQRMEAAGFRHGSAVPKGTLAARIAELVQMKQLVRVAPGTYRLSNDAPEGRSFHCASETQQEARIIAEAIEKLGTSP